MTEWGDTVSRDPVEDILKFKEFVLKATGRTRTLIISKRLYDRLVKEGENFSNFAIIECGSLPPSRGESGEH